MSRRELAAGKPYSSVSFIERGAYTPGRDWIEHYLRLGDGTTYAELAVLT